jgi:hypothetical protein
VVGHQGEHSGAVHEVACEGGLDRAAGGAEVLVGAEGFGAVGGCGAKVNGGLGGPAEVGAEGAGGDERASLEYLLGRVTQDTVCDG